MCSQWLSLELEAAEDEDEDEEEGEVVVPDLGAWWLPVAAHWLHLFS